MTYRDDIYDNQTAILKWLRSLGDLVEGLTSNDDISRHQRRSCKAKRRFATEAEARECQPSHNVYPCGYCGGYHLTMRGVSYEIAT